MTDLLLIHPPFIDHGKEKLSNFDIISKMVSTPPLGLAYLAKCCMLKGYSVEILDMEAEKIGFDKLKKIVKIVKPSVAGLGVASSIFPNANRITEIIKEEDPDILTVIGASHASVAPDSFFANKNVDFVIRMEGEEALVELLDFILKGKGKLEGIGNLSFRYKENVLHNPTRELIKDLDSIPFPARELLPNHLYYHIFARRNPITSIITSRGCPYSCIFCCPVFRTVRKRTIGNVILELKEIIDKFGITDIEFFDETFNLVPNWSKKFCDEIVKQRIEINWRARCRPDLMSKELARKMKKAGCYMVSLGSESANDHTLNYLKKGYTTKQIKAATKAIKKSGMEIQGYFILGSPVETKEDMERTIRFAKKDYDFVSFCILTPLPGTELYDTTIKEGLYSEGQDLSLTKGMVMPHIKHPTMTPEEIQSLHKKAYLSFFLSKQRIKYLTKMVFFNPVRTYKILYKLVTYQ